MLRRAGIGLGIAALVIASAIPLLSGIASAALVRDTNVSVCDRTEKVRDAIVTASGVSACALVTSLHIRDITTLDLSGQGITSLKAGDFDGLHRLDTLDLSGNSLATLPAGLFDDLYLLRVLRLNDNRLTALPVDIFDQLFLLEELTLTGNRLTALPEGMFDDLSRFKGVLTGDDVDGLARIRQFLADKEPETVEEFIAALPDLHKERFVFIYGSQALGSQFVSSTHPRVISWGADAEFIFTWLTNPDATDDIRKIVEFLIPGETQWTAGVIDFSTSTPQISQPALCQTCHGSQNKPLLTGFDWVGTEYFHKESNISAKEAAMRALVSSTNPRISPLDLTPPIHSYGYHQRLFKASPGAIAHEFPAEEAGKTFALRHAEVLLGRLKARDDYSQFAENTVCDPYPTLKVQRPFKESREHTLGIFPNSGDRLVGKGPPNRGTVQPRYYFNTGTLNGALLFLVLHDLWDTHESVRDMYRATTNTDAAGSRGHVATSKEQMLLYPSGQATAEDELLQLYRIHFGAGSRATLALADSLNPTTLQSGSFIVDFEHAHTNAMAPRVCQVLRNDRLDETRAHGLTAARGLGRVRLTWTAPTNLTGVTGYRIMRGAAENSMTALVADTGSTATAYTDTTVSAGTSYVYSVIVLKGSETGTESVRVTVDPSSPRVAGPTAFTVVEGDTAVATLTATDEDTTAANVTWSTYGGADSGSFTLSSAGVLAFSTAKDFESPDDAGGNGSYQVAVQVSDGERTGTADLTVTLSNRNEAPTADAGDDQENIAEGATVTLSGAGTDPDAGDTLTYAWTQTGGTTVTLASAPASATTFTAPTGLTEDETLAFTLRVTDAGGLYAEDPVEVTIVVTASDLTARFEEMPETHDGSDSFTFELRFSEELGISYRTLQDHAFTVTGGEVVKARRLEPGKNVRWEITVRPSGNSDVTVELPATADCTAQGAICTEDGRMLSNSLEVTVSVQNSAATGAPAIAGTARVGETLTASATSVADLDGLTNATFTYRWLADDIEINGATGSSYTLAAADRGKAIKVRVSFADDRGNAESLTSTATATVSPRSNSPAGGAPTITGTAQVGQMLTASTAGISDPDGLTNATFTYRWLADDTEIGGAAGSSYTLVHADRG